MSTTPESGLPTPLPDVQDITWRYAELSGDFVDADYGDDLPAEGIGEDALHDWLSRLAVAGSEDFGIMARDAFGKKIVALGMTNPSKFDLLNGYRLGLVDESESYFVIQTSLGNDKDVHGSFQDIVELRVGQATTGGLDVSKSRRTEGTEVDGPGATDVDYQVAEAALILLAEVVEDFENGTESVE